MKESIRQHALELGFDACRFTSADPPRTRSHFAGWLNAGSHGEMQYLERNAARRADPQQVLPGARSVVCLATSYASEADARQGLNRLNATAPRGVVARYARYDDYHDTLGRRLKCLSGFVDQIGGPGTKSLWYVDTGPVLERDLAERSGLGFIGKHTNLISRQFGNWILLAEILTTLELEPDAPEKNRCGSCTRCLDACPTRAITGPFQLHAPLCISYLTIELRGSIPVELRAAMGNRIFGCDDCLEACPWNRFAREGRAMKEHARPDLGQPDLIPLLDMDEGGFQRRFAGSPILRAKRRGLLRNVCVALGNVGDAEALPALTRAVGDSEPLIAEHARWAIDQIRLRTSANVAATRS